MSKSDAGTVMPGGRENMCPAAEDFSWIDEYISRVKGYIFVREEDCLLIKRPNNVIKLNASAAAMLKYLLAGRKISEIVSGLDGDLRKLRETMCFFLTLRAHLEGRLSNPGLSPAVKFTRFEMDFCKFPVLSEIALTYRCNLRCKFCYASCGTCRTTPAPGEEMTTGDIRKVLRRLFNDAKVPSVSFTGGEPTLRQDLPALVKYASRLGMRVNLISNGTLIDEKLASRLASAGLASAQLSIEATNAELHDSITCIPGSFDKTLHAFTSLKKAGVLVHTNTTLSRMNLAESTRIPEFVKNSLQCDRFSMNLVIPAGTAAANFADVCIAYSEIGAHIGKIIELSRAHDVEFMWYSPLPMCIFNTVANGLGNRGCSACDGLISVAPDGAVLPCASCADPVGNLLRQEFREIWDSEHARMYRDKKFALNECRGCENFSLCNGACLLYWQQADFDEIKSFIQSTGTES